MTTHEQESAVFTGAVALAIGSFGVVLTSVFYALSPVEAALPIPDPSFGAIVAGVTTGRTTMTIAGTIGIFSDVILAAGALLLMIFRTPVGWMWERLGWAFVTLSVLVFIVVDALAAGVLTKMLRFVGAAPALVSLKLLFDTLFALGTVVFGVGAPLILYGELKAKTPAMHKELVWAGIAAGAVGLLSGLLYFAHVALPLVIGLSIAVGSVVFGIYGVRLARSSRKVLNSGTQAVKPL